MQASKLDDLRDPPPAYTPLMQQPGCHSYGSTGAGAVGPANHHTIITITNPTSNSPFQRPGLDETIFVVGGCPACRVGVLDDEFTFLGLLCAIVFFPIGILCCLALRQRRCLNCGAVF